MFLIADEIQTSNTVLSEFVETFSILLGGAWLLFIFYSLVLIRVDRRSIPVMEGGILNHRAVVLPPPSLPPVAEFFYATGAVQVDVLVSEYGEVISATPTGGDLPLQKAAVAAARRAEFPAAKFHGKAVQISGTIVYDFSRRFSVLQIGFALAASRFLPALNPHFPAADIAAALPPEWEAEQAELQSFIEFQTVTAQSEDESPAMFDLENIHSLLEKRFESDELENWSFELGSILGRTFAQIDEETALPQNLTEIGRFAALTPPEVASDFAKKLDTISSLAASGEIHAGDKKNLLEFLLKIK